ncbi:response regulator [bacterium]|nr:response regulator [bacterium]
MVCVPRVTRKAGAKFLYRYGILAHCPPPEESVLKVELELSGKRILIITADGNFRDFLLTTLEDWEFDVILTDLRLSDGTGLDLTRKVRGCGLDTPIALMISCDPSFSEISAFAEGAQIVFQKPFGLKDLLEGLSELFKLTDPSSAIPSAPPAPNPSQCANRAVFER